MMTINH